MERHEHTNTYMLLAFKWLINKLQCVPVPHSRVGFMIPKVPFLKIKTRV